MKKEKEIIEENTNGEKNKYLDRQNVKAFYEFDTFEFMQPDENGLGLSENNIVVAEKEMLDKDGKTITVFEFFKDGRSIAITNEKGEIIFSDQYKELLKTEFKEYYKQINLDKRLPSVITKEDIDKLSIKKIESVIFDLTDNLGKKDIASALEVLHNLIYEKEPLAKILVTLYNHFKKLYITKMALRENKELTTSLNLKPNQMFLTTKYKVQSKYFKENELRSILQDLCDLDYNFKSGKIDLQVGMETILCRYCS